MSSARTPGGRPTRTKVVWVNKPPAYRRVWTYIWLLALLVLALLFAFSAFHGYQFPCRIGNGGVYNCEATSTARWTAAIRDGIGAICPALCVIAFISVIHALWANFIRPELLKQKVARMAPTSSTDDDTTPVQE